MKPAQYTYRYSSNGTILSGYEIQVEETRLTIRTFTTKAYFDIAHENIVTHLKSHDAVLYSVLPKDHEGEDHVYVDELVVTLDDLRSFNNLDDCTAFSCMVANDGTIVKFFNRLAETHGTKTRFFDKKLYPSELQMLLLYVPFRDATFNDCKIKVTLRMNEFIVSNKTFVQDDEKARSSSGNPVFDDLWMPAISITAPDTIPSNGMVQGELSVVDSEGNLYDHPMSVYLDSTSGYLPKRKIEVLGTCNFPISSLGLSSGDTIRVKAGFKWYTNIVYKDIMVE